MKIESESTSGQHSHVDHGGIHPDQQIKNISGASVYNERGISTTISKKEAHLSCISTAIEHFGESISERHRRVDQGYILTARAVYIQQH